ncbi:MAG: SpoIIE family protein phosphatase [Bacteroidetes bacterium]|nr:SpoIIE family protein phosphatase [Bacteroidota bacterium]
MLKFKILDWKKPSTKIIVTVFSGLFLLSGYFIFYINFHFLDVAENNNLERLKAISNTLALNINGDDHRYLCEKYTKQGQVLTKEQDSIYYSIWKTLKKAYDINKVSTEIATLVLEKNENKFYYIVNSNDKPYVRDPYIQYHKEFLDDYEKGNIIHQYTDEYGTWLTAFSPIKDKNGKVTGIVEVDDRFDVFISQARKNLITNLFISIAIFILTVIVLLRYIKIIMFAEEESKKQIEASNQIISRKNKDILDSITYARRIQTAILAPKEDVFAVFTNAFILYNPKDIVSGDFYYFSKTDNGAVIAAADCTGHGVPGALMSMIGNDLLSHIIREVKENEPAKILDLLHKGVTNILKQDEKNIDTKDGMDIALLNFDESMLKVQYAGAYRPLYIVRNKTIIEYKANKFPIGNKQQERSNFTNNEIELQKGDMCYVFTDGYADQFGGDKGKKFMMKRFSDLLLQICELDVNEQEKILKKSFEKWMGAQEQVDDVLVIGIRI